MCLRRTIARPAAYGTLSSSAFAVGWLIATPVFAGGRDIDLQDGHLWTIAWFLILVVGMLQNTGS